MVDVPTRTLLDYLNSLPSGGVGGAVTRDLTIRDDLATGQQAVPPGGSTGEVLVKLGDGDFDTGWTPAGQGTVQTITVDTANGFAGASDGDPSNPTLTLSTTVTGLLKGDGTEISAAVDGTDFQGPITLTTTGSGGAATFDGETLNIPEYPRQFNTVALMLSDEDMTYGPGVGHVTPGDIVQADIYRYAVAEDGSTDYNLETEGGVKLYVLPDGNKIHLSQLGAPKGNLSEDATDFIQLGVDLSYSLECVLVIDGKYRQTGQVVLPSRVRMAGVGDTQTIYGDLSNRTSLIHTYHQYPYFGENGEDASSTIQATMTGITWINQIARDTDVADDTTLFRSISFTSSSICRNLMHGYATLLYGSFNGVSEWKDNFCVQIRGTGFDGPSGSQYFNFVDSSIVGGYMNGDPTKNATLFRTGGAVSRSRVSGVYIDFFKNVELIAGSAAPEFLRISDCTIEYSWRVVHSPSTGLCSGHSFIGNTFTSISSASALSYFENADSDMTNEEWCIIEAAGTSRLVYEGNTHSAVTKVFKNTGYPNYSIKSRNNVYGENTAAAPSALFDFAFEKSAAPYDLADIYIEELDNLRVPGLPSASLSGINSRTFDRQCILFEGVPLWNDSGSWRLMSGVLYDAPVITGNSVNDQPGYFTWGTNQDNGTAYWVITSSASPPTTTQIKTGKDESGAAAPSSGTVTVTVSGPQPTVVPGGALSSGLTYYVHMVHQNSVGYISRIASGNGFVAP